MKKQITISAPKNDNTGLPQRKLLKGVSINPITGHLNLSFEVQQLDMRGNPLSLQDTASDSIEFHNNTINDGDKVIEGNIPPYVADFMSEIYSLTEAFLAAHTAQEGGEDES